ncbi:MAG: endolytic transglycosylase MltG [Dehalococcoidia bacterium]|nr:endolytic transglycosylase MltG [Dehalococcoidia bacterium]
MSEARRATAVLSAIIVLACAAAAGWFVYRTPGSALTGAGSVVAPKAAQDKSVRITVDKGESATDIGDALAAAGVVRSARLFEVLVGITGVQDSLEAGEYDFDPGLPAIEVVRRIAAGKTASREVTIPEGLRVEQVGALLQQANVVSQADFLAALVKSRYNQPFLSQLPGTDLEGFIFPAAYQFSRNETAAQVVQTMLQAFQDNVADTVQLEGQDLTLAQVVTLASIIEREAAVPADRPLIASVYLNRLRAGIPLQADPTVQFALANAAASVKQYGWWKSALTLDDLKVASPYNTYINQGLPPGPIANPGLASIEAVIRPARTNYLFFVAKPDGSDAFAETLAEHLQNVRKYQPGAAP